MKTARWLPYPYASATLLAVWLMLNSTLAPAHVLLGAFLGLVNGVLVSVARVPSLVITLGTLYAFRGVDVAWAGADQVDGHRKGAGVSSTSSTVDAARAPDGVVPWVAGCAPVTLLPTFAQVPARPPWRP